MTKGLGHQEYITNKNIDVRKNRASNYVKQRMLEFSENIFTNVNTSFSITDRTGRLKSVRNRGLEQCYQAT